MSDEKIFWGIHAGRSGEEEQPFIEKNVITIGWKEMDDLSGLQNRDEFKQRYEQAYPDAKQGRVSLHAGILYRFVREIRPGNIVVFPRRLPREIWLGKIAGEYQYDSNSPYPHIRKVEWEKNYPRTKFSQGALYEVGSATTLFQIRNYSDEFAAALEQKGLLDTPAQEVEEETIAIVAEDIEQQSRDFVLKQLSQKLKGHALAEFVGHLLDLMGYKTKMSPPGPDRGIDIIAHKDNLGIEPPTIIVQVKSSDGEINEATVSELYGKVTEKDFGIFVALGGFNKRARDFASSKRNLRLIDSDELVDLIYEYYEQLDGKYKALLPLRKVYVPEILTG